MEYPEASTLPFNSSPLNGDFICAPPGATDPGEETGIGIRNLNYVGSQCWPFPGQLMIGFTADYAEGEIVIEREELEDAAWFPRNALPPTFSRKSIAGWMMNRFA